MMKSRWLLCILSMMFASVAVGQTNAAPVIPIAVVRNLQRMAMLSLIPNNSTTSTRQLTEKFAAVEANGNVLYGDLNGEHGGTVNLPADINLFMHTHPYGAPSFPSGTDIQTAERLGIPNCVITLDKDALCAMPNGSVIEVPFTK